LHRGFPAAPPSATNLAFTSGSEICRETKITASDQCFPDHQCFRRPSPPNWPEYPSDLQQTGDDLRQSPWPSRHPSPMRFGENQCLTGFRERRIGHSSGGVPRAWVVLASAIRRGIHILDPPTLMQLRLLEVHSRTGNESSGRTISQRRKTASPAAPLAGRPRGFAVPRDLNLWQGAGRAYVFHA
jgi:hypothetical protein